MHIFPVCYLSDEDKALKVKKNTSTYGGGDLVAVMSPAENFRQIRITLIKFQR